MPNNKKQKNSNINLENYRKDLFKSENKDDNINLNNKRKFSEIRTVNDYGTPIINNKLENQERTKFLQEKTSSEFSEEIKYDNIKYKINNKCPGCYPIFQQNQLGHVGPNGCLGDYE
jgi:hypothetical protein